MLNWADESVTRKKSWTRTRSAKTAASYVPGGLAHGSCVGLYATIPVPSAPGPLAAVTSMPSEPLVARSQ